MPPRMLLQGEQSRAVGQQLFARYSCAYSSYQLACFLSVRMQGAQGLKLQPTRKARGASEALQERPPRHVYDWPVLIELDLSSLLAVEDRASLQLCFPDAHADTEGR